MNKITLLFTIIIGVIQFTSAQTFTAGSYKYRVIKDGVSVAAASQKLFGNVIIPEAVNFGDKNYKVTAVADSGFRNCAGIKNLILPASITKIGKAAFWGCESLKSIIIPNSITELEPEVFSECAISQISIPNTITKIGNYVFYNCNKLKRIHIPDSVKQFGVGVFGGCSSLKQIRLRTNLYNKIIKDNPDYIEMNFMKQADIIKNKKDCIIF